MAEFVLQEVPEFDAIPDGEILEAILDTCEQRESRYFKNADDTPQLEVSFRFRVIEDGDWFDRIVFGNTPTTFSTHSDCKLRMWVQELLSEDQLPVGFKFDTDTLVGQPCRIVVSQYKSKAGKAGNSVQDVLRARTTSARLASEIF